MAAAQEIVTPSKQHAVIASLQTTTQDVATTTSQAAASPAKQTIA